jgi:hypothetical protein
VPTGASANFQVSNDNGHTWTSTSASQQGLEDGHYLFRVTLSDASGHTVTSAAQEVTVDTQLSAGKLMLAALEDTGSSATDRITRDNSFTLQLSSQEAGASVQYQISSDHGQTWQTTTASQSALTDGEYLFRAQVSDAAGNTSTTATQSVTIDTQAPALGALNLSGLSNDLGTASDFRSRPRDFTLRLSSVEANAAVSYQVSVDNGVVWRGTTASQTALKDGTYLFRAQASDLAGNLSTGEAQQVTIETALTPLPQLGPIVHATADVRPGIDFSAFGLEENTPYSQSASPLALLRGDRSATGPSSAPASSGWDNVLKGVIQNTRASEGQDWISSGKDWDTRWLSLDLGMEAPSTHPEGFQVVVTELGDTRLAVLRGQADQQVTAGEVATIQVPRDAFAHISPDAKVLLSLSMHNQQPLPAWIRLDPRTGVMTVKAPANAATGPRELVLRLGAQDETGEQAMTVFRLIVRDNDTGPSGRSSFSDKLQRAAGLLVSASSMNFQTLLRHG